ncbi:Hypothetical predicted protein, partial [Marmota monax]
DSLDVRSQVVRNSRGQNRKSPALVSRMGLGTGGTDGVQALGNGNPLGQARLGCGAAGGVRCRLLLSVCFTRLNTLELAT